ncbi:MAG: ABC transporter ATP-binding protein [Betaproteobacteria bacterium]|nr:ABC transporter ATP-binding protein [Betaproteobacteria bacterium]
MLEISNLRAGYGAINILWDVSLSIAPGKVTTLIGPNGAGKTTLMRAIMGMVKTTQGEVKLAGKSLLGVNTWDLVERGICMIPEGRMIFRDMTVAENLMMGAFPKSRRSQAASNLEHCYTLFPRLRERHKQLAGSLSGGEAQMVAMARGLMSGPQVVLIDEPSLGLAPVIVQEIIEIIATLRTEGKTIVLVEQNTQLAVRAADHVYLMQSGKIVLSQPAPEVDLDHLHDLYFARQ